MADIKDFLRKTEGLELTPYTDERGISTVGYGANLEDPTTRATMSRLGLKDVVTEQDAARLMDAQLEDKAKEVKAKIPNFDKLDQGRQTALMSLMYNNPALVGPNLSKHVEGGNAEAAAKGILLHSNKAQSPGLAKRRVEEAAMFNGGKLPPMTEEEKAKIKAQLARIKNDGTRAAALERFDELSMEPRSTASDTFGVPMINVSTGQTSSSSMPPESIRAPEYNIPAMADAQMKAMAAKKSAAEAKKNDADRQKGLNAIPFDPAINAYPDSPMIDQDLLSQVKQLGMPSSFEPPPLDFPLKPSLQAETPPTNLADRDLRPPGVDENVELSADTEELMTEPDANLELPEVEGNDYMARFKAAQENKRTDQMLDAILRAGNQIGTAIGGQGRLQANNAAIDAFKPLIGSELEDLKENETARRDNEQHDTGSVMSDMTRTNIATQLRKIGANKLADQVVNKNMSYDQLTKVFGAANLQNMVSQYEAAENRLAIAKERSNNRKEKDEDKKEERKFDQEKDLRKEIAAANKVTGLSTLDSNYRNLKASLDSGKFTGLTDVMAIYATIKAIDPGSVVKEGEVSLVVGADSPLRRFMNLPAKITRGDLASPKFRQMLVEGMGNLRNTRAEEFNTLVAPTMRTANRYGLDSQSILNDTMGSNPVASEASKLPPPNVDMDALAAELKRRKGK